MGELLDSQPSKSLRGGRAPCGWEVRASDGARMRSAKIEIHVAMHGSTSFKKCLNCENVDRNRERRLLSRSRAAVASALRHVPPPPPRPYSTPGGCRGCRGCHRRAHHREGDVALGHVRDHVGRRAARAARHQNQPNRHRGRQVGQPCHRKPARTARAESRRTVTLPGTPSQSTRGCSNQTSAARLSFLSSPRRAGGELLLRLPGKTAVTEIDTGGARPTRTLEKMKRNPGLSTVYQRWLRSHARTDAELTTRARARAPARRDGLFIS